MFVINKDDKSIHLTRGDIAVIVAEAETEDPENSEVKLPYTFAVGDIVRLTVYEKKKPENVVLQKDVEVSATAETVDIELTKGDTKIGGYISKPTNYHYEIELNPDTAPQTIIGHDKDGPKLFVLYPEGGEVE